MPEQFSKHDVCGKQVVLHHRACPRKHQSDAQQRYRVASPMVMCTCGTSCQMLLPSAPPAEVASGAMPAADAWGWGKRCFCMLSNRRCARSMMYANEMRTVDQNCQSLTRTDDHPAVLVGVGYSSDASMKRDYPIDGWTPFTHSWQTLEKGCWESAPQA